MKARIANSTIKGSVTAPPSKSYTIRGLMCAALARGRSRIASPLASDDTTAAATVLKQIGVSVQDDEDGWRVGGGCLPYAPWCRAGAGSPPGRPCPRGR